MTTLNETHDPGLTSWVQAANAAGSDFPIQNLPFGTFRRRGRDEAFRSGVAIGDSIVDLAAAWKRGVFSGDAHEAAEACCDPGLNRLMALGPAAWSALRLALSRALRTGAPHETALRACLMAQNDAEMTIPARVGDYTDFYASIYHATAVGRMFRPDNPLLPNYKWVPIAYHGRASSIVASGTPFVRPWGQVRPPDAEAPVVVPAKRLDFEYEIAVWIGQANERGSAVPIERAEEHIFGLGILNDWSARDVQAWEYQPLGPFLAKNFATTVSPWIVTLEALAPFRTAWTRAAGDPQPLAYLDSPSVRAGGAFDVQLVAWLQTADGRAAGTAATRLAQTNLRHAYWTVGQMVAHHTMNGCNLQPGDVFGTGTMSGPAPEEAMSLLELTNGGKAPLALEGGGARAFLEDGDSVLFRACCEAPGAARIGFGACTGTVLPAAGKP